MKDLYRESAFLLALALSLGCDNKTSTPDSTDPLQASQAMQPIVDKWSAINPSTLPAAPPSLAHGRKVMVVFFDPPVAYAPPSTGSCFATKPEEVGLVVLARGTPGPARLSATGAKLHDKTWQLEAIAIPEGKRVASWSRRAIADETVRRKVGGVYRAVPVSSADVVFAGFPGAPFDADCASLQAGAAPPGP